MVLLALGGEPTDASSSIELVWDAPAECPTVEAVREDIAALVREDSVRGPVHAEGRLTALDGRYTLEIAVQGPDDASTRTLEGDACAPLARAAALIVAVAADPMGAADPVHREPAPIAIEPTAVRPRPVVQAETRVVPVVTEPVWPRWRHRVALSAHGGAVIGIAPATTGGIEAEIAWLFGPIRIGAIGSHWFARTTRPFEEAGIRASVSGGGVRACYAPKGGSLEFPLCTGLEISAVVARGEGDRVVSHLQRDWMLALPASVGLDAPIGRRLVLRARLEALVGLRRPLFELRSGGATAATYRSSIVGLRIVIGAGVRLP